MTHEISQLKPWTRVSRTTVIISIHETTPWTQVAWTTAWNHSFWLWILPTDCTSASAGKGCDAHKAAIPFPALMLRNTTYAPEMYFGKHWWIHVKGGCVLWDAAMWLVFLQVFNCLVSLRCHAAATFSDITFSCHPHRLHATAKMGTQLRTQIWTLTLCKNLSVVRGILLSFVHF